MSELLADPGNLSTTTLAIIAGIVVVCLLLVVWLVQRRGHMAFMRGGANRQPRLAVQDACAVDTRRRLVLVRRDNVEHLIMIGGPSDIVIESGIGGEDRLAPTPMVADEDNLLPTEPLDALEDEFDHEEDLDIGQLVEETAPPSDFADPFDAAEPTPRAARAQPPDSLPVDRRERPSPAVPPPRPMHAAVEDVIQTADAEANEAFDDSFADQLHDQLAEDIAAEPSAATVEPPAAAPRPAVATQTASTTAKPTSETATSNTRTNSNKNITLSHTPEPENENSAGSGPVDTEQESEPRVADIEASLDASMEEERIVKTEFEDAMDAVRELVIPETSPAAESPPAPEPDLTSAMTAPRREAPTRPQPPANTPTPAPKPAPTQQPMTVDTRPETDDKSAAVDDEKPKTEPTPPGEAEEAVASEPAAATVSAEDLIADFDRVLQAEMSKVQSTAPDDDKSSDAGEVVAAQAIEKDEEPPVKKKEPAQSLEDEMKKLLGDFTFKREDS